MNAISVSVMAGTLVVFMSGAVEAVQVRRSALADYAIMALFGLIAFMAASRGWAALFDFFEQPEWMKNNPIFGYFIFGIAFNCAVLLLTGDAANHTGTGSSIGSRNLVTIGLAVAIGVAVAVAALWAGTS
jgi:hypothetical protein